MLREIRRKSAQRGPVFLGKKLKIFNRLCRSNLRINRANLLQAKEVGTLAEQDLSRGKLKRKGYFSAISNRRPLDQGIIKAFLNLSMIMFRSIDYIAKLKL